MALQVKPPASAHCRAERDGFQIRQGGRLQPVDAATETPPAETLLRQRSDPQQQRFRILETLFELGHEACRVSTVVHSMVEGQKQR